MSDHNEVQRLDATGLRCPLPVLRARKMLKTMNIGAHLQVEATDAGAPRDFAAFCETAGYRLLRSREEAGIYYFLIERSV